jgi:hypothetical protein
MYIAAVEALRKNERQDETQFTTKMYIISIGAVKIYVAAVEALRKNERQDETQFTIKM